MPELQPTFLHNRELIKANVRDRSERDSEQKSGNAEAFRSIHQSNQRLKALKINSKFFFFGSLFLFACPQKEKVNKEQTISKVLSDKLKRYVRGNRAPRKAAFTLAEVLITLGIIGVVAAMTLPTLISKYKANVVETSLKKFYSMANQAVNLSVAENGETKYWSFPNHTETDPAINLNSMEDFYNKYFKKYLKVTKIEKDVNKYMLYFADGSGVYLCNHARDWVYCLDAGDMKSNDADKLGRKCFMFGFYPKEDMGCAPTSYSYKSFVNKGIEPYVGCLTIDDDGNPDSVLTTKDDLYDKPAFYTKAIQLNNWKIPKDYPIRF